MSFGNDRLPPAIGRLSLGLGGRLVGHASTGGGRVMRATFDYFAPDFAKRVID